MIIWNDGVNNNNFKKSSENMNYFIPFLFFKGKNSLGKYQIINLFWK